MLSLNEFWSHLRVGTQFTITRKERGVVHTMRRTVINADATSIKSYGEGWVHRPVIRQENPVKMYKPRPSEILLTETETEMVGNVTFGPMTLLIKIPK